MVSTHIQVTGTQALALLSPSSGMPSKAEAVSCNLLRQHAVVRALVHDGLELHRDGDVM